MVKLKGLLHQGIFGLVDGSILYLAELWDAWARF